MKGKRIMTTKTIDYRDISGLKPKTITCNLSGVDKVILNNLYGEFAEPVAVTVSGSKITLNFYNHGYIKFTNVTNPSGVTIEVYKENETEPTYNDTLQALCEYKGSIPDIVVNKNKHLVTGTIFSDDIDISNDASYEVKNGKGWIIDAKAGSDSIIGTAGNDTFTGGLGTNTIIYDHAKNTNFGQDTIKLTKNENLIIDLSKLGMDATGIRNALSIDKKNNLVLTLSDTESIKLASFAKTNGVGADGSVKVQYGNGETYVLMEQGILKPADLQKIRLHLLRQQDFQKKSMWEAMNL